ncbi:MAG: hypothetical protein PHR19_00415 [Bacteroidales bacterium]|jgi:hypothetical protein|nr:hypothetical protein [Bacteroidales bacterium]HHT51900.1 hypothetical protein [Bacteroidales bacterium]
MSKLIHFNFLNYFPGIYGDRSEIVKKMEDLHYRFPASSVVNLFYLRILQDYKLKDFEKKKSKLLLTLPHRATLLRMQVELPKFQDEILQNVQKIKPTPPIQQTRSEEHQEIDSLITQFTQNPPKMIFLPERHDASINFETNPNDERFEPISETLAIIYAEQGYTGKAVKMFKKLGLLFPEKSSYFADQIKKIKNKDN